ncbi:MAG: carboxypeptidase regulatory-like domain-containing protein [Acidobacteria bacterium]|nr:carboxypeptidase regulatory-like domain-containing protein [Acidobacteriota bacterium]
MAQSQNVSGTVVDSSGAVIPAATVTVTDLAKASIARQLETDAAGRFQAIGVQPGRYSISVEKTGFKKAEITLTLDVNAKVDVGQIKLDVGQLAEVLSVNAEIVPMIQTNTMEKAYLVDQVQMSQLPMNGRNFTSLMSTMPGMSSSAQSDFGVNFNDVSQFHGLGGRGSQNNFYLDGSPNLDVGDNQSQYTQPSIDTIAEFRVLQSAFNAEYGRNEGMAVAVQTKSGSAKFHGTLYEYLRNNAFDAKCVLCNTLQPQLRYNQFGGNFSGWVPIPKVSTAKDKKMFFFYNREMTRRNLPSSSYADVPSAQVLGGDFSPWLTSTNMQYAPQFKSGTIFQPGTVTRDGAGNITGGTPFPGNVVPTSQLQPLSYALLKVYQNIPGYASLPAAPNPGYVRYYYNNPDQLVKNQDLLRIDYAINSKMNSFFRWVNDYQKETIQTGIWTGEPFPIQPQVRPKPGSSWSWNLVSTFTPTLASETILSYNHQSQSLSTVGENPVSRTKLGATFAQLYPAANITDTIPNVNASPITFSFGDPGWHNDGKDYAITENLSWVKGSHTFKFGYYYNRDNKKQTATWPMNPTITFDSSSAMPLDSGSGLANLMLGNFQSYTQASAAVFPYFRFLAHEAYAQDSWKVTRRLTVEYGIRFEHMVPTFTYTRSGTAGGEGTWTLYSVDLSKYNASNRPTIDLGSGKIVGDPMKALSGLGLVCDPCAGTPRGFSPAKNLFAPRLGIAYDVFGDGKTALRTGFGVFHERLRQNNFYFGAGGNWPNLTSASALYGNVASIDTSVTSGTPQITPPGLPVWASDNTVPTVYSWYAGIQHQLPKGFTLDVSYSGNHTVHLMDQRLVNGLPAGTFVTNPGLSASVNYKNDALRPYYGWGSLNAIETLAYSRYNAMMFRVSRRFANSLSANFNYTWSKAMDLLDNDSDTIINPYNMRQNWAAAGYDQPNVVTLDFVYELPKVRGSLANGFTKTALNGWELTGMIRSQSGMPISISSNGSTMGVDSGSQYPNLIGDAYAGQSKYQWLNPAAFARPADGSYGNLHRNALRLPGVRNVDASIMKNFAIGEAIKVTFRAEAFNLFNHPQIWGLNTSFTGDNPGSLISTTNRNFGTPSSWRDARVLQLALRFAF